METIKTIGLDIAKSVFQVHGVDGGGRIVVRRRLTRSRMLPFFAKLPPCVLSASRPATTPIIGRAS